MPSKVRDFFPPKRKNCSGAHPDSYSIDNWVLSGEAGVNMPEREADHSPPSSYEVKNGWSYTSIAPLHGFTA